MADSDPIRFVVRCACLLPLVLTVPMTNWVLRQPPGPAYLMRDFDGMARALEAGKTVFTNVDARSIKVSYLRHSAGRPEVLILGSSRAQQIAPEWFAPKSAWNAAVVSGGIDDFAAYFELCVEACKLPEQIVLELNPTLMGGELGTKDWRGMAPYFDRALTRYGLRMPWRRRFAEVASLNQLKWNLRTLKGLHWQTENADKIEIGAILPTGQIIFPPNLVRTDAALVAALGTFYENRTTSQPGEFEREIFRHFLDDVQSRHIRIVAFLAPVHPAAYEYYSRLGGYDERWLRQELTSRGIAVAGSYSPETTHATRDDFFDEVHPRAPICRRILEEAGVIEAR